MSPGKNIIERAFSPWKILTQVSERSWYPWFRDLTLVAVLGIMGALSALVITEPWSGSVVAVNDVKIGETEVPTGDARPDELVRLIRSRLRAVVKLQAPGFVHHATWADLGASVDTKTVEHILTELGRSSSPVSYYYGKIAEHGNLPSFELPIEINSLDAVESLAALKDMVDRKPRNAMFDFKQERVVPEKNGLSLNVYATLSRLDSALEKNENEVEMVVEEIPAPIKAEDLQEIDVSEVLGFFSTPYSRMRKDKDRTHNVLLGSLRLDGQVILPGEEFSFNEVLGARNEAKGFRYAPVIAGGVLVEGMGGGTCQVASTLYASSFFAGLIVIERQTHSRPSSYIKLGLDATVSFPDIDLKLKNPFSFPVVIHMKGEGGNLVSEIRGRERPYTVTFLRKTAGTKPFPIRIIEDSNLAKGEEVITQNGIPGYTVQRYQVIEAGKVGYRFKTVDMYPPTTQFVHRGVATGGAGSGEKPRPDLHKPYHASAYLRMVQGSDGLWYERFHD